MNRSRLTVLLSFATFAMSITWNETALHAQATRSQPFNVQHMLDMDRIGDPQVSPDAHRVAFVVRETDREANRGRTDLWMADIDGANLRRLTTSPDADLEPRWAPDGQSIYFLSTRSGSMQVWQLPLTGGEARQITREPLDVGNLKLSPDGKSIAYTMDVFPAASPDETKKRLDEKAEQKTTGQLYDRLFFRHWDTWKDGRRSHIFVRELAAGAEAPPIDVMLNLPIEADSPTRPFGGSEEFSFTPDGRGIVFTARNAGRDEAWSTNTDLFHVEIGASAPPRNLTASNKAADTRPVFAPDGRLAYLRHTRPGYESDKYDIVIRENLDSEDRVLTRDWDYSAGHLVWSPDGRTLYTTAGNRGQSSLFAIDVATGKPRTLVEQGYVGDVAAAGERILYGMDHLKSPVELYTIAANGSDVKQVTRINAQKLAGARMGEAEQFSFPGWNDETVFGYVVAPVDFDPAKKYPIAFLIHGGPQGSFGNHFHYRWNPQAYAGAGYAVVMIDFHGSTGYGQAFCDSIRGDWGGKPLEDLQKGLAAALEKYRWLDGDRVAALGASYGGYMINWIAGNWPDRFRCLVNHDGNLDERMAYFDTEELWFPEWEHGGTPWENPQGYTKHNPIDHVNKWKTPMLVIHGGRDYRVVDVQGMATFTALQRRGIPSKFLYFPDENHWVLKPANSVQWHETVIAWLDEWTKK